jgi:hypothetical protein
MVPCCDKATLVVPTKRKWTPGAATPAAAVAVFKRER